MAWSPRTIWEILSDKRQRQRWLLWLAVTALALVAGLALLAHSLQLSLLDLEVTLLLQGFDFRPIQQVMAGISSLGYSPWAEIIVGAACLAVGRWQGWRPGAYLLLVTGGQGLVNHLIKILIGRPRPPSSLVEVFVPEAGNSFPSGHVMFYTVFFGFLFFLAWARLPRSPWRTLILWLTGFLVLAIGPSRIYLGAHWLSDVIAAYLISITILIFAIEGYVKYFILPQSKSP